MINPDNLEGEPPSDAERAANYRALHKLTREERFRLMTTSKRLGGPDAPHVGYNPDGTPITQKQYLKEELALRVPAFPLPDLLAGKHDYTLRELAAKSVGWTCVGQVPENPPYGLAPNLSINDYTAKQVLAGQVPVETLPNYPTSLDACKELRDALTEEERIVFMAHILDNRGVGFNQDHNSYILLSASPLHLLIAFCLTKNLIKLQ